MTIIKKVNPEKYITAQIYISKLYSPSLKSLTDDMKKYISNGVPSYIRITTYSSDKKRKDNILLK